MRFLSSSCSCSFFFSISSCRRRSARLRSSRFLFLDWSRPPPVSSFCVVPPSSLLPLGFVVLALPIVFGIVLAFFSDLAHPVFFYDPLLLCASVVLCIFLCVLSPLPSGVFILPVLRDMRLLDMFLPLVRSRVSRFSAFPIPFIASGSALPFFCVVEDSFYPVAGEVDFPLSCVYTDGFHYLWRSFPLICISHIRLLRITSIATQARFAHGWISVLITSRSNFTRV